jgi:cysteine desulfuration protein SufE
MDLERLYKNFEVLGDWQDRYRFLIDLGKQLPPLPEAEKTERNRVHGCMSSVHMVVRDDPRRSGAIEFSAQSDALIVNGLIAVLDIIYNHRTPEEIEGVDIESIFKKLGLEGHISPNRRNGFFSMVERLRNLTTRKPSYES